MTSISEHKPRNQKGGKKTSAKVLYIFYRQYTYYANPSNTENKAYKAVAATPTRTNPKVLVNIGGKFHLKGIATAC